MVAAGPGGPARPLPAAAAGGHLIAQDPQGILLLADPHGGVVTSLLNFGSFGGEVVVPALDRRFVASLQGAVLAVNPVDGLDLTDIPGVAKVALLGGPDTFADGDRALVLVQSGDQPLRTGTVSILSLADRHTAPLGIADEAAGDPRAVGVFVSVPDPTQLAYVVPGGFVGLPDSRVKIRPDQGRPAAVLATAAQFNADLGQDPAQPVHLSVFPDPAGDAVAVMLSPPTGGNTNVSLVVLDRQGRVRGVARPPSGPTGYSWPSWSPDGKSLAYATHRDTGTGLAVWTVGGRTLVRTAPDNGAAFGYCVWAPDGSAFVCPTFASAHDNWDIGSARGGRLFSAPAPGTPIVWSPPGPAR